MIFRISLLDGFDGSAGDSLIFSQGQPFSTEFPSEAKSQGCNVNDEVMMRNSATVELLGHHAQVGGWWFPTMICTGGGSNLNGRYLVAH